MRSSQTRAFLLVPLVCGLAGCGGEERRVPLDGAYTRAAFHLMLLCPGRDPHTLDLLYPVNSESQTFTFAEDGYGGVTVTWDGELLATGWRNGNDLRLDFTRRDPFTAEAPIAWRFRGRVRDDLAFHERTVVGSVEYGVYDDAAGDCTIAPRSVAWFTTRPRALGPADRDAIAPSKHALADGQWNRFVWFLDVGPFAMTRKGDPGQRGANLRLFSFTSTGAGRITAGDQVAFVDNGFPDAPWQGAARGRSVVFSQPEYPWSLDYAQDVLWDDGRPSGYSPGIRRVLAGFVTGSYRVEAANYPPGWEGETGLLPMQTPGMAFWLDVDRGPDAAAAASSNFAQPVIVSGPFAPGRKTPSGRAASPAIVVRDGVVQQGDME